MKPLILQAIYDYGWQPVGTFQDGVTLNNPNSLIQDETDGVWYRWDDASTLPKVVAPGSTPAGTGGIGVGAWQAVDISDVLRKDLAEPDGFKLIGQVPDIATLRTMAGENGKAVLVTEYRSGCGFGGGQLFWDSSSTDADNGITIFAVTGVTTGRWKRKYKGFIDAHWAGLPLNSATDDCYAQMQAIEQLMFNEHVSCYFHNGTYNIISQNMPWKNPDVPPSDYKNYGGASIICDGPGVIFKTTSSSGADVFNIMVSLILV
ncbi:hypothetical protein AAEY27_09815 [Kosakonia sp. BYX6]|uniref:Tail spike TSP1/Gp66 N-terminal domain-containing protein n=1 Tax=Kosakonia calanthes TaxID=3139408 RepID=A0ABZ3BAE6_9ENTR